MKMTVHTDYALRIMMYLAAAKERATIDEIAGAYDISRNHVMKIVQRLATLDYIKSVRGRQGGLELARPATQVNIGILFRELEDLGQFVECFNATSNQCRVTPICGLKGVLSGAVNQYLAHLDKFSLEDLVPNSNQFLNKLQEQPAL